MFSPDGTLISASAAPHCGGTGRRIFIRKLRFREPQKFLPDLRQKEKSGVGDRDKYTSLEEEERLREIKGLGDRNGRIDHTNRRLPK